MIEPSDCIQKILIKESEKFVHMSPH